MDPTRHSKDVHKDQCNHEKFLREHFSAFNLMIDKTDSRWNITISRPNGNKPAQGSTLVVIYIVNYSYIFLLCHPVNRMCRKLSVRIKPTRTVSESNLLHKFELGVDGVTLRIRRQQRLGRN